MKTVRVGDPESLEFGNGSRRHALTALLEATDVAINRYRVAPGDGLPSGLHAHMDQEEVFYILEGTATFDTMDRVVTLEEGEAIRFGRGEFQSGKNGGDRDLVVLAIGAPRDTDDVRIPVDCPACGHGNLQLRIGGQEVDFRCVECDSEFIPDDCPQCGHDELRVTRGGDGASVVRCQRCESEFERPPIRNK
ncbi:cupin domain-containing protein [Halobacteria archaeon AArc-curdl1]|uniref:Cupin domain-containing protein n=1 Tax=Natronosalvus hydrolyticus TaxID=2979988 RepID=A0AAP2ZC51_9EURY|nr:cupin domain-containing protein [Halobacteria archaeon AArc-curdl1]